MTEAEPWERQIMKVIIQKWDAVAQWRWKLGKEEEDDEDLCGICRVAYDACCPDCKLPGDDCPLRESLSSDGEPLERVQDTYRLSCSIRQMPTHLPYALYTQMGQYTFFPTTMPLGSETMG